MSSVYGPGLGSRRMIVLGFCERDLHFGNARMGDCQSNPERTIRVYGLGFCRVKSAHIPSRVPKRLPCGDFSEARDPAPTLDLKPQP